MGVGGEREVVETTETKRRRGDDVETFFTFTFFLFFIQKAVARTDYHVDDSRRAVAATFLSRRYLSRGRRRGRKKNTTTREKIARETHTRIYHGRDDVSAHPDRRRFRTYRL